MDEDPADSGAPVTPRDVLADRFGLLTRDEIANLPPARPLITDTLDRRTLALLAGHWGTGKSFVALDWACCVATGHPWQGRQVADGAGRVLYVVAEGAYGIDGRISAWEKAWRQKVKNLVFVPRAVDLMNAHDAELVAAYVADQSIDLVVIDTLSRCMAGADENAAKDMSIAVRNLDRIKDGGDGTCVLAVHHTGKDRTTVRGSSALEAASDTVYAIEGDSHAMTLSRTKRKDGPRDDRHQLGVRGVPGTDSAIVSAHTERIGSGNRVMSAYLSAFNGVGATKAELRAVAGLPPSTFHRGLSALLRDGDLINTGTDRQPFYVEPKK